MHQTGEEKKRQVCIGNMYNYTLSLHDDPQNVKGDPAAKSSLFVHQDDFFSLPGLLWKKQGLELPVITDVLWLVSQLWDFPSLNITKALCFSDTRLHLNSMGNITAHAPTQPPQVL